MGCWASTCCFKSLFCSHFPSFLKFGDTQHDSKSTNPASAVLDEEPPDQKIDVVLVENGLKDEVLLKSSVKKPSCSDSNEVGKGNVKWMDHLGKELVEIREFEPSDSEELEGYNGVNSTSVCVIQ
uniref:Uncharacterized protein n=1 Tax=Ananas comosus var. bracteatus TaxID=296719 RepID=A0A6V7NMB9_ANACO|nr:unnamed protein product [Ananas comosus var. bracteatus]